MKTFPALCIQNLCYDRCKMFSSVIKTVYTNVFMCIIRIRTLDSKKSYASICLGAWEAGAYLSWLQPLELVEKDDSSHSQSKCKLKPHCLDGSQKLWTNHYKNILLQKIKGTLKQHYVTPKCSLYFLWRGEQFITYLLLYLGGRVLHCCYCF